MDAGRVPGQKLASPLQTSGNLPASWWQRNATRAGLAQLGRLSSVTYSEVIAPVLNVVSRSGPIAAFLETPPPLTPVRSWEIHPTSAAASSLEPPLDVQPDIVRGRLPYRPLPPALGPVDGRFLTPRVQNYQANDEFTRRMAAAGQEAVEELTRIRALRWVTPADVWAVLQQLGEARRAIAHDLAPEDFPQNFGQPAPASSNIGEGSMMVDEIRNEPGHRHAAYHERALRWTDSMRSGPHAKGAWEARRIVIEADGERHAVSLCFPLDHRDRQGSTIYHPSYEDAGIMQHCAYARFAEVLNRRDLTEQQAMYRLGQAYFLLSQGLPMRRGTPSCVEPLIDATLRVTHGVTLPPKREGIEPVWEAIFTGGSRINLFAHNFRHLFE
jgi:hypothetical protein